MPVPRAKVKKKNSFEQWEWPLDFNAPRNDLGGLTLAELQAIPFEGLGRFKRSGKFLHGYSTEALSYYAPRDPGVHAIILWTLLQTTQSLAINMYGFADEQAAAVIQHFTENPDIAVSVSLDKTQAAGVKAQEILKKFNNQLIGNSIAIGRSIRGAISHDKMVVVDGIFVLSGSTNWSFSGEVLQDNQLTLARDPVAAAEARTILDMNHDAMLKQMAGHTVDEFIKDPDATEPAVPA
jgi:hypothetical protein